MAKALKRLLRRAGGRLGGHFGHLRLGLHDRLQDRLKQAKSLRLERLEADAAQFSLIWTAPQFPRDLLSDAHAQPLEPHDLGRAQLGRAAGRRFRHYFWVPLGRDGSLALPWFDGRPMHLQGHFGDPKGSQVHWTRDQLAALLQAPAPRSLSAAAARSRALAQAPAARARFGGAWLLVDRAERADDNAEHFYRHLQTTPEAGRIFFVLDPQSPDWPRLQAEGFRLLAFGSADHVAAVANAALVIASQTSLPLRWPLSQTVLQDMARYRFVFLQHGVIMNDMSSWLNDIAIDLFITSTPAEYTSITDPDSPYRFSARDTVLTGLARHDALLARPRSQRYLTVAPTWRSWLAGPIDPVTMLRPKKPRFAQSDYARNWRALLADPRLLAAAQAADLEVLLLPHPNLRSGFPDLDLPAYVQIHDPVRHGTYQEVIAATGLCVTDYSSLSMDMAFLDIPVVYFQFDAAAVFGGRHSTAPGYFDYGRDGFGPVTTDLETTLKAIDGGLGGQAKDPVYARRRDLCFAHRDGQNGARIHAAILRQLGPFRQADPTTDPLQQTRS